MSTTPKQDLHADLLSYEDLQDYVNSTIMYDQRHASKLWITLTAFLPTDVPEYFIVQVAPDSWLSIEEYRQWCEGFEHISWRRNDDNSLKARMKWKIARQLVEHFEEQAASWTTKDIYEYGYASRALTTDWLNYAGRSRDSEV